MQNFVSGHYIHQGNYKSFQPEDIHKKWTVENMKLLHLLSQADRELGRLDMYSEYIPNIDLFISMYIYKEATQSSKIEGIRVSIKEALLDEKDIPEEKRDDWQEVQNYIMAFNQAMHTLKELPFSSRLIKQAHKTLLFGVRGRHKRPGEFRSSQNWIGGSSITNAIFIPPIHSSIDHYMGDLEKFAHSYDFFFPELLKIALIHYQFETIHPFLDGNGRVGRLMIPLYLVEKEILKKPILYLSDFFERNKTLYYDNLMRVREKNDITQWFMFFLDGVIETAKSSSSTFDKILKLQKDVEDRLQSLGSRAANAHAIMEKLYQHPIVHAQKAKKITGLSSPSVYELLEKLENLKIIQEITGGKRGKVYLFREYVNVFSDEG